MFDHIKKELQSGSLIRTFRLILFPILFALSAMTLLELAITIEAIIGMLVGPLFFIVWAGLSANRDQNRG
jgi:hypothetical protein